MLGFAGTRKWVYDQWVDGRFQRIRRWTFAALQVVLFLTPWIPVGGHPALRIDLPARRLYAFGEIFTAADTILLLLLLLALAFSLFFFTSLFGRLWCGYACPQTVFLDAWIRPIERWIEGEWTTRRRRDQAGLSWDRAWRKAAKWSLFALASVVVAAGLMSYFTGAVEMWTGQAGAVAYGITAFVAGAWFLDFVWFREQFCNYVCPYARLQSALVDDLTLQIGYDAPRAEPRGGGRAAGEAGHCIDCFKCVNVCPQGIDIRNGFQMECIGCARCIDACTDVMGRFDQPTLISYTSQAALEGGAKPRLLRPRVVAYGGLLGGIGVAAVLLLANRVPFEAAVSRAPGSLYTLDADGYVRNTYLLRIDNNSPVEGAIPFEVTVEGLEDAQVVAPELTLRSTEHQIVPLVVRLPLDDTMARTLPLRVRVEASTGERLLETTFKSGGSIDVQGR